MLNKTKNLTKHGKVVIGVYSMQNRINNITEKLLVLKAQKLQLKTLGYITNGVSIDRPKSLVKHGQINRNLPYKDLLNKTNKFNALSLCCNALLKGKATSKILHDFHKADMFPNDSFSGEIYAYTFARLLRKAHKKGINFKIERYNVSC